MNAARWGVGNVLVIFLFVPALAQPVDIVPEDQAVFRFQPLTPSRVLAGLHGYPDWVVPALVRLAEHPDVLQRAAEAVQAGREPVTVALDVARDVREALQILAPSPEVLVLAAACPEELDLLRSLWSVAPEGVALRLRQLRDGYEQAARAAAQAWQQTLENNPVALGEYRDLLTRYCEAAREADPAFASVRVTDRRYYYACPPDEALILFTREVGLPQSLSQALAAWWAEYAPQRVDAELTEKRALAPPVANMEDCVYGRPAGERAAMWQPVEAGQVDRALGLVPVILQPPADQPAAARLAFAVAEHVRLWSQPMSAVALPGPDVESRPAPDAEKPIIVIAEPIPGPQTARRDEVAYGDLLDLDRAEYELRRYRYGYPLTAPYYYGPTYYHLGTSVFEPYGVCYPGDPYYLGGVYLRAGQLGVRAYGSSRSGRIHYGGGRHYGRVSVSAGSRSGYRHPQVYMGTRSRRQSTRAYSTRSTRPLLRQRSVYHRRSVGPIRRSSLGTRTIRAGRPTLSTARRQAILSRIRAIRAGSYPAHSGTRVIRAAPRPSGRAIRPPSQRAGRGSAASGRSRSGGVRRR